MRRKSWRRMVNPCRSKNSRIWIATLRPLSSRSRNSAAVNLPVGDARGNVDGDLAPCLCTTGRAGRNDRARSPRRRRAAPPGASGGARSPRRCSWPWRCRARAAADRARRPGAAGSAPRCAPPRRRTSPRDCGRRTQVRSSTTSPASTSRRSAAMNSGAGSAGLSPLRSCSRPMPGRSGRSAWKASSVCPMLRAEPLPRRRQHGHAARRPAATRPATGRRYDRGNRVCRRVARSRAKASRSIHPSRRQQQVARAPRRVPGRQRLESRHGARACAAAAPARADR